MTLIAASLLDAAVVLALGLAAAALARKGSAAVRHAILATAVVAAALMPAFELLLPPVPVIGGADAASVSSSGLTMISGDAIESDAGGGTGASLGRSVSWTMAAALVWLAGALAAGAALLTGIVRLATLRARCTPVDGRWRELTDDLCRRAGVRRRVALLQSEDRALLVACGVLRPAIVLPAGAAEWTESRMRVVLLHELAHIRRHDALMQAVAEVLRVLHWINPLVWIACRRLRHESECACDDAVLRGGVEATDYASHLLDVARQLSGRQTVWASAPAIAHPSTLERRIAAMLHRHLNRATFGRRGWAAAALVGLGVSLPIAAAGVAPAEPPVVVPPTAGAVQAGAGAIPPAEAAGREPVASRQANAAVSGRVVDQSGGTLPGVRLTLTDTETGVALTALADAAGRFDFPDLRASRYQLEAQLWGFAVVRSVFTLAADASVQRTITLPLGTLQETVTVTCSGDSLLWDAARAIEQALFPVLTAQEPPPATPIRVGGNIRPSKKIKDVKPVCPRVPGNDTAVRLIGRIGIDGFLYDVTGVPAETGAEPPSDFVDAALDAVRQWQFTPTQLNRDPVEIDLRVDVVFRRE